MPLNGREFPLNPDEHLVSLLSRSSQDVQPYKNLRYSLETLPEGEEIRAVAVTSAGIEEGKTTTSINLAGAAAHRRDARVLLVDADLRRPAVAGRLGMVGDSQRPGLSDLVLDPHRTLSSVVQRLSPFNLWFLSAGRATEDQYELLRTPRLAAVLQDARKEYDLIVVDTAPLLPFPDSRVIQNLVDAVLLVVAAHRTPRRLVEQALNLLDPSRLIRLVYNGDDQPAASYYGHYYGSVRRSSRLGGLGA
jgi:capsular exopolysaccharide synthesis family protein